MVVMVVMVVTNNINIRKGVLPPLPPLPPPLRLLKI